MSRIRLLFIQAFSILYLTGCASNTLIKGPLIRDHQSFQLKLKHPEINFSDEEILIDYFSQSKLKTEDGRKKLTQNIIAFFKLKQGLSQGQIIVPPKTTVRILISSFCASHNKATPDKNEIYQWVRGDPNITLIRPVIDYFNKSKIDRNIIQELIWNLSNNVLLVRDVGEDLVREFFNGT